MLRSYKARRMVVGGNTYIVDKANLKHILTRHHASYWDGTVKASQTFFDDQLSINDVVDLVEQVIHQSQDEVMRIGPNGRGQVIATVEGVKYQAGLFHSHQRSRRWYADLMANALAAADRLPMLGESGRCDRTRR